MLLSLFNNEQVTTCWFIRSCHI